LARVDLLYLWAPQGRHKVYWFYRRAGQRIPITSSEGKRLAYGEAGFLDAYERIHESFGVPARDGPVVGTLTHLIESYRAAPEFRALAPKTRLSRLPLSSSPTSDLASRWSCSLS